MPHFICTTCGTQHAESDAPPVHCVICEDDRQYVKATGQQWTTLDKLGVSQRNSVQWKEPGLIAIGVEPHFAIGQRAFLIRTAAGNILWDCLPLLDRAIVEMIASMGGLAAIAISHPHYYSSMVEWSRAFGGVPIHLHAADRQWVMRPDESITFWEGDTQAISDQLTIIRCGGHFDGGSVLHWRDGADGKGVLLTGDIIQVVPDRKHVSFMYSYPNYVPLSGVTVRRIERAIEPFAYDRLYGAFWDAEIREVGRKAVSSSVERYLKVVASLSSH